MSITTEIQRLQTAKADIKSAIEEKGVTVGDGTIDTYADKIKEILGGGDGSYEQGYENGYEDGKNSMPNYLQYVTSNPFWIDVSFPENLRDVQLNFLSITKLSGYRWFAGTNATSLTIIGENIVEANLVYSFYKSQYLKYVDFSKCGNGEKLSIIEFANAFQGCALLERIIGNLDLSNSRGNGNCFSGCTALKEFRVIPSSIKLNFSVVSSPNLSAETRQSIIDGLAQIDTAQTITFHTDCKILQSQVDDAKAKGWTVAGGVVVSEEEYYG